MLLLLLPYDTLNIECHAGRSIYTEVQLQLDSFIRYTAISIQTILLQLSNLTIYY